MFPPAFDRKLLPWPIIGWQEMRYQMTLLRSTLVGAIAALIAAFLSFDVFRFPVGLLCFVFFILWVMWLLCALLRADTKHIPELIGSWIVISLAILLMNLSMLIELGDLDKLWGADVVLLISYAPVLVPSVNLFMLDVDSIGGTSWFLAFLGTDPLISSTEKAIRGWAIFTAVSAIQGVVVLLLGRLGKAVYSFIQRCDIVKKVNDERKPLR